MLAASLIDLDEKTIPDAITVPGTLLGIVAGCDVSLVAAAGRALRIRARRSRSFDAGLTELLAARRSTASKACGWRSAAGRYGALRCCRAAGTRAERGHGGASVCPSPAARANHVLDSGWLDPKRGGGWRRLLRHCRSSTGQPLVTRARRVGWRRRRDLGRAADRHLRPQARGDGLWRCDADGDDRHVCRLAGVADRVLRGARSLRSCLRWVTGCCTASAEIPTALSYAWER